MQDPGFRYDIAAGREKDLPAASSFRYFAASLRVLFALQKLCNLVIFETVPVVFRSRTTTHQLNDRDVMVLLFWFGSSPLFKFEELAPFGCPLHWQRQRPDMCGTLNLSSIFYTPHTTHTASDRILTIMIMISHLVSFSLSLSVVICIIIIGCHFLFLFSLHLFSFYAALSSLLSLISSVH